MGIERIPGKLAIFVERRPVWIIVVAVLISLALAPGNLRLEPETGFDTMLPPHYDIFDDTEDYMDKFGAETVIVLIEGQPEDILTTENLAILGDFEETMSNYTFDEGSSSGTKMAIHTIISPVTILKETARLKGSSIEWNDQELVEKVIDAAHEANLQDNNDSAFAGETSGVEDEKPDNGLVEGVNVDPIISQMGSALNDLIIHNETHMLIKVNPSGKLSYEESLLVIEIMEGYFAEPSNQLTNVPETKVIGEVEMIESITGAISDNLRNLLGLCVAVMAVILLIMFRVRWNLLSLFIVGIGAMWTFGIMGYMGVPLSMTSMAVLPILIGIGIDYSIQFHNRYEEEAARRRSVKRAIIASITQMFPVVGIALVATVIGFITLFISEVPMVQDFGVQLAVGVTVSYVVALFLLHSIVYMTDRNRPPEKLAKAIKQTGTHHFERALSKVAKVSINNPIPIVILAVGLGIVGGIADQWLPSKVDHEEMMPQGEDTLEDIQYLRDLTGYQGELRFIVKADDVTSPEILLWFQEYEYAVKEEFPQEVALVNSPATLVRTATKATNPANELSDLDEEGIDMLLERTPNVFKGQFISTDEKVASLSVGVKHMPVEDVQEIKEHVMKNPPNLPEGVSVEMGPVGNMAMGAEAVEAMVGKRVMMNGICLAAIFVVLLFVYRRLTRALATVIPVGFVIGWSSLALYLAGIPLNTMSAVLGVLIIGVGTEFIVLLLGRYEEEKNETGASPHDAMVVAISQTGRAIVTTAMTTLGGFAVLIASNFVLTRDFGIATTLGVFLCLINAIVVVPPMVVWWDERVAKKLPKNL
ncbi:MAG: RND family transporter [Chloroflexi bacterium]|nr:RND family transporter [Chloroflexota bacterium]